MSRFGSAQFQLALQIESIGFSLFIVISGRDGIFMNKNVVEKGEYC